jgi:hypothetical protein
MIDIDPTDPKASVGTIAVKDSLSAPIIYFDGSPNFGHLNGIINVTVAAARHLPNGKGGPDGIGVDVVAVAFLRATFLPR